MDSFSGRQRRHRGWKGRADEAAQLHRGRRPSGAGRADGSQHTAARTLVALGAFVAQDLRNRDGVARPLLRHAAVRMIGSRREVVRRLGATYLHRDPPTPEELSPGALRPTAVTPPSEPRQLPPAGSDQESHTKADESGVEAARPKDGESSPGGDPTA